ncbi:MAG: hypothetical protein ABI607_05385 [Betaproteobacteria bacterium]
MSVLLGLLLLLPQVLAIPLGYQYVGSLIVSGGRHVYWYWNMDFLQLDASGASFIANMYARNVELNEERPFVAIIRCDNKTYRSADSKGPFEHIEEGDPVLEVWRAGCEAGRAVTLATRNERLNGIARAKPAPPMPSAETSPAIASNAPSAAGNLAAAAKPSVPESTPALRADERRVDRCVKFVEGKGSQFGDAAITNTCAFPVEVAYCYKGGRAGAFDCPTPPRRMRVDSLGPGATRNLPEYRRGRNNGVALVACKGTMGSVIPVLNGDAGKTGCT